MAESVGHIGDEVEILTVLATKQSVNGLDNNFDDIDILPLVETTNVICFGNLSIVEDRIYGASMINDIEPVAHILALTIYRERLAMTYIVDKQRYQLLGN